MNSNERRESKRIALNHPVLLEEVGLYVGQRGEILDASARGMRVRITQSCFCVGKELNITSLPQRGDSVKLQPFRYRVVWENAEDFEVGLECLQ
jgi:hypothetical protein